MKKVIGLGLAGALLSLVLAAPVHAAGGRGSGFRGQSGMHGRGVQHQGGFQHRDGFQHRGGFHHGGGFQHRGAFHRGCCWGGAFVGWPVGISVLAAPYYAYPDYGYPYSDPVYPDPAYLPAPAYQPQPQVYLTPPAQSEVCYVGGCYRLQGDGVSAPFQWVWIPTVPAPPPAPPSGPPAFAPAPGAPAPADPAASRSTQQLYRWIDEQGVTNWTNSGEAVPDRYHTQPKRTLSF